MRALVVFASADGSTEGIADRIAERLRERGHDASARPVSPTVELESVDAVVLGSAVHARQWLDEATTFVNTHRQALHRLPFWTFSVGMPDALPKAVRKMARTEENAIIDQLGDLQPWSHRLFSGVLKPSQFPVGSRVFLRLAGIRYGDYRDWSAIDGWATEIANQLDRLVSPATNDRDPPERAALAEDHQG